MTNLFRPGIPVSENPCVRNACTKCCRGTDMPLTNADMERLGGAGFRLRDFAKAVDAEGFVRLFNTPAGNCFFLEENGRCRVQDVKPEGCRSYPFIYDGQKDKIVRDDFCPYNKEFKPPPEMEPRLRELVERLEMEAQQRLRAGMR